MPQRRPVSERRSPVERAPVPRQQTYNNNLTDWFGSIFGSGETRPVQHRQHRQQPQPQPRPDRFQFYNNQAQTIPGWERAYLNDQNRRKGWGPAQTDFYPLPQPEKAGPEFDAALTELLPDRKHGVIALSTNSDFSDACFIKPRSGRKITGDIIAETRSSYVVQLSDRPRGCEKGSLLTNGLVYYVPKEQTAPPRFLRGFTRISPNERNDFVLPQGESLLREAGNFTDACSLDKGGVIAQTLYKKEGRIDSSGQRTEPYYVVKIKNMPTECKRMGFWQNHAILIGRRQLQTVGQKNWQFLRDKVMQWIYSQPGNCGQEKLQQACRSPRNMYSFIIATLQERSVGGANAAIPLGRVISEFTSHSQKMKTIGEFEFFNNRCHPSGFRGANKTYDNYFKHLVQAASLANPDVPEVVLSCVLKKETNWRSNAVSHTGARGAGQQIGANRKFIRRLLRSNPKYQRVMHRYLNDPIVQTMYSNPTESAACRRDKNFASEEIDSFCPIESIIAASIYLDVIREEAFAASGARPPEWVKGDRKLNTWITIATGYNAGNGTISNAIQATKNVSRWRGSLLEYIRKKQYREKEITDYLGGITNCLERDNGDGMFADHRGRYRRSKNGCFQSREWQQYQQETIDNLRNDFCPHGGWR